MDDSIYFARRAAQERVAAMKAVLPWAQQAHLELADRHDDLARSIGARGPSSGLHMEGTGALNGLPAPEGAPREHQMVPKRTPLKCGA